MKKIKPQSAAGSRTIDLAALVREIKETARTLASAKAGSRRAKAAVKRAKNAARQARKAVKPVKKKLKTLRETLARAQKMSVKVRRPRPKRRPRSTRSRSRPLVAPTGSEANRTSTGMIPVRGPAS